MKLQSAVATASLLALASAQSKLQCPGTFNPISAADFVKALNPGWNLGNTLDAVPEEGRWNNPPVAPSTFDDIKASGFKSIRLPVTWTTKIGPPPTYTVNSTWLERVSTVLDQITSRGFYAIVNVHHDSLEWFDFTAPGADVKAIEEKFYRLWYQIGEKLGCKSNLVAFEPINEPKGTTMEHADVMNRMNAVFLKAINDAGGFNAQRVVTLVGLGEDSIKTSQWFKPPTGYSNPWALQYHYYSPYDFIFTAWGKTIWGSDDDKKSLETDLKLIRQNFTDIPLVIGEWAASPVATESAARWKYMDHFIRMAAKYNTATMLWDNGADFLDRASHAWRDPVAERVIIKAAQGAVNSLPDSTEDAKATSQTSSAHVFHKVGEAVNTQTLPFKLNGNTVKGIQASPDSNLTSADYSVSGSNIVFTTAFLNRYINTTATPGIKANLTISFSQGASSQIQLVQWDIPTLGGASTSKAEKGKDIRIPITWKGIAKPAAVKAISSDGKYLADDWTQYLGPLQQGYATYNNHWNWDAGNLILTKGAVDTVANAKKSTTFTFEFWPRVPGNSVKYTLTA
ncbi:endoglucanase B [Tothia fuscella]|uniref:Endoglucanase B n=1 Tax=Tothia fuscella TaxID=1048955 RepID=A0A9P4P3V3_9PEZI|nr:endoglucanase B [Tothia fuscella]